MPHGSGNNDQGADLPSEHYPAPPFLRHVGQTEDMSRGRASLSLHGPQFTIASGFQAGARVLLLFQGAQRR
jgi:hypothetical protein